MAEVYTVCFPNGKLYVGITTKTAEQRFQGHCRRARQGSDAVVHNAIRKYGPDAIRLITLHSGVSWEEAKELEVHWIARLETTNRANGYNMTAGGEGSVGFRFTSEQLQRLSDSHKGLPGNRRGCKLTVVQRAKLSASHKGLPSPKKGRPMSDDQRAKLCVAQRRRFANPVQLALHTKRMQEAAARRRHRGSA